MQDFCTGRFLPSVLMSVVKAGRPSIIRQKSQDDPTLRFGAIVPLYLPHRTFPSTSLDLGIHTMPLETHVSDIIAILFWAVDSAAGSSVRPESVFGRFSSLFYAHLQTRYLTKEKLEVCYTRVSAAAYEEIEEQCSKMNAQAHVL